MQIFTAYCKVQAFLSPFGRNKQLHMETEFIHSTIRFSIISSVIHTLSAPLCIKSKIHPVLWADNGSYMGVIMSEVLY